MAVSMSFTQDETGVIFPPLDFFGLPMLPFCITAAQDLEEWQCLSNMLSGLDGVFASEPTTSTRLAELSPDAESMQKRGAASIEATSPNQPEDQTPSSSESADYSSLYSEDARSFELASGTGDGTIGAQMIQEAQQERLVDAHNMAAAPMEVTDEDDMVQESNTLFPAGPVCQALVDCTEVESVAETDGQDQSIDKVGQPRVAPMPSIGCHEIGSYDGLLEGCSGLSSIANPVSRKEQGSADADPGGETDEPAERAATPPPCVGRAQEDLLAVIKDINSILEDSSLTDSQALEKIRALDHFERAKSLVPQRVAETARSGKPITHPRSSPETVDLTAADQNEGVELPARHSPSTSRKRRRGSSDTTGHISPKKLRRSQRQSMRRLADGFLINRRSLYVVDEKNHPVSCYLED